MKMNPQAIIERLGLLPHPGEGGYYRETYRSNGSIPPGILPEAYRGARSLGTAIYYMLTPATFSSMHRLPGDEIFHFYLGDPVTMLQISPEGARRVVTLGSDVLAGHQPQCVVPANYWQGSFLNEGGEFALLGTTMSPGFDFQDFELGSRADLTAQFPESAELIRRLTHG